jgi:hypothetical protein
MEFKGEPVPPGIHNGAAIKRNSQRLRAIAMGTSASASITLDLISPTRAFISCSARLHFCKGQVWIHHYNQLLNHLSALDELLSHI